MTEQEFTLTAPHAGSDAAAAEQRHLTRVLVPLFKGVVYQASDSARWDTLVTLQPRIRDHVSVLGLELMLDEAEGWAFLRTRMVDDEQEELPRLMTRRALSFPVSLLVALLRKRLVEFDVTGGETRLVISRDEIVDMLRLFMPDTSNEAKLIDQVDTHINKVIELGFLRKMKSTEGADRGRVAHYEVKRIIRAFVDAQWLSELDDKLAGYAAVLRGEEPPAKSSRPGDATRKAGASEKKPAPEIEGKPASAAVEDGAGTSGESLVSENPVGESLADESLVNAREEQSVSASEQPPPSKSEEENKSDTPVAPESPQQSLL